MTPPEQAKDIESVIESDRYTIQEEIGRGCNGVVYSTKDTLLESRVAVKILDPVDLAKAQMAYRNLSPEEAIKREAIEFTRCTNIVPRKLEVDKNGKLFIVMPEYKETLAQILNESHDRHFLGYGLGYGEMADYLKHIAHGLNELHTKINRPHGDLKLDNIEVDGLVALLNDFGAASLGASESPRDNIGYELTRAPECFEEGSKPTKISDVWAFGSLMYRMITKDYIFEDESKKTGSAKDLFANLDEKTYNVLLKKKLKKVPKKYRQFLKKSLAYNPNERYYDGSVMESALNRCIEGVNIDKYLKTARKVTFPILLPALALTGLLYIAGSVEPKEMNLPKVRAAGKIGLANTPKEKQLEFASEELDLPEPKYRNQKFDESVLRQSTRNKYVAYLLKTYHMAARYLNEHPITNAQAEMFTVYSKIGEATSSLAMVKPAFIVPAKSIEVAITKSQLPNGKIDLEDTFTIARLGVDKWNEARRAAGNFDFKDYIKAKNAEGEYIIPENEQKFLKTWLAYTE